MVTGTGAQFLRPASHPARRVAASNRCPGGARLFATICSGQRWSLVSAVDGADAGAAPKLVHFRTAPNRNRVRLAWRCWPMHMPALHACRVMCIGLDRVSLSSLSGTTRRDLCMQPCEGRRPDLVSAHHLARGSSHGSHEASTINLPECVELLRSPRLVRGPYPTCGRNDVPTYAHGWVARARTFRSPSMCLLATATLI